LLVSGDGSLGVVVVVAGEVAGGGGCCVVVVPSASAVARCCVGCVWERERGSWAAAGRFRCCLVRSGFVRVVWWRALFSLLRRCCALCCVVWWVCQVDSFTAHSLTRVHMCMTTPGGLLLWADGSSSLYSFFSFFLSFCFLFFCLFGGGCVGVAWRGVWCACCVLLWCCCFALKLPTRPDCVFLRARFCCGVYGGC